MIRIVGIQPDENLSQEFVLLQNQGSMRVNLRGHALVEEPALDGTGTSYFFPDEVDIMPGQYVVLRTSPGTPHWSATADGPRAYYTYMGRLSAVWNKSQPVHLLGPQHTYVERPTEAIFA